MNSDWCKTITNWLWFGEDRFWTPLVTNDYLIRIKVPNGYNIDHVKCSTSYKHKLTADPHHSQYNRSAGQFPRAPSSIILAGLSLIITNHEGPGIRSLIPDVMIRTPDSDFCDPDNTFIDFR